MRFAVWCILDICAAVIMGLILRNFVCFFVRVKGTSMMETLKNGEILFVRRYALRHQPRRGDVVICRFGTEKKLYLKRVIAMPGETVFMENDHVIINDRVIREPYITRRCFRKSELRSLGSDEYFLLGDNRPVSRDSRKLGNVSRKQILGRSLFVLWPFSARRRIYRMEEYETLAYDMLDLNRITFTKPISRDKIEANNDPGDING